MMLVIDRILFASIRFVIDKLIAAAEAELDNDDVLRERLLNAQMQLELGELDMAEFEQVEADVLARLREIQEARRREADEPSVSDGAQVVGVEAVMLEGHDDGRRRR